jgi:DNA mismatch repair protein MutS
MSTETQLTPMMAQYRRIKGELPRDALLLFRLGDFYEMFFEDAQKAAPICNLTLTRRQEVPMCGIPYHAAGGCIARLLRAGSKVAICDQMEDARPGKLVKREVTQILSPATHFDERMLHAERNNFLAAISGAAGCYGLVIADLTTGDFRGTELASEAALLTELERLRPAEIIIPSEARALRDLLAKAGHQPGGHEDWVFAAETAQFTLRDHFNVASLDGFGLRDRPAAVGAAGAVLHYLAQHLRRDVSHLTRFSCYEAADHLVLDSTTLRNLEILEPLRHDAPRPASLYAAMNRAVTPMGARRLREWLSQPLAAVEPIRRRQDAVQLWLDNVGSLERFRAQLAEVRDLERTLSRLSVGTGNARDAMALRLALERIPEIRTILGALRRAGELLREEDSPAPDAASPAPPLMQELAQQLSELPDLVDLLKRALVDEPPLAVKEGGMIRAGFDAALDELLQAAHEGKDWVARLQQEEIERTGIPSLKVRFNSVFGYYIEVTKANLAKVPPEYIRKQTVANGERFITPALKEMEGRILGAEERSLKLEYEIFLRLRESIVDRLRPIQDTASALAQLDVLAGFAEVARVHGHCAPEVRDETILNLRDGRHPVLDQSLAGERFVPNDTELDARTAQIMLITGPNMAGKSTYIRQVALITLLAHTGAFVPAASARVDLVDRIFTRIGASDDLARGQSTFMVEMSETANILNNATQRSLIILDEVGRGTSTFDGLSLAWSIVEHLHNQVGAKTLFATHYHELTELAGRLTRLRNYNVAVREWNDQVVFLRKIVAGGTDKSYGIQVARLAGVPREVLERARVILRNLEDSELTPEGQVRRPGKHRDREKLQRLAASPQMDLFA